MLDRLLDDVEATPVVRPFSDDVKSKIEAEIKAFDAWFSTPIQQGGCGNEPMVRPETALLRTYLAARMTGRFPSVLEPK